MEKIGVDRTLAATKLRQWLDALKDCNVNKAEIAKQVRVTPAALYNWQQADESPISLPYLVRLLTVLRHHMPKQHWDARIALDWATLLGYTWNDINQMAKEGKIQYRRKGTHFRKDSVLIGNEKEAFLDWWHIDRPKYVLKLGHAVLTEDYTERNLFHQFRTKIAQWKDLQKIQYQGIVLWGSGGIGKTTLARALALDDEIQDFFHDGIIWIDTEQDNSEQWAQSLCEALGLEKGEKSWIQTWCRWAKADYRRCLVILDDVTLENDIEPLIKNLGSQISILITTQIPRRIEKPLARWLPSESIYSEQISELECSEVRSLVARITKEEVNVGEMNILKQVRRQLGWTPEIVILAAFEVKLASWIVLQGALQEGDLTDEADLAQRHLARTRKKLPDRYRWLQELVRIMEHRWAFGVKYGMAVWRVPRAQATRRLHYLTQAGLLARLQDREPRTEDHDPLWQVWPWVYALLPDVPITDRWWQKPVRGFASAQVAQRLVQQSEVYEALPWGLHIIGMLPMIGLLVPEVLFFLYYTVRRGKRTWSLETWKRYAPWFLSAAGKVKEQAWKDDYGVTQEYWLLLALPYRTTIPTLGIILGLFLLMLSFSFLNKWIYVNNVNTFIRHGFYVLSWLGKASVPLSLTMLIWEVTRLAWIFSQADVDTLATKALRWLKRTLSK